MAEFYQSGHRQLQEEFQSTALADRLEEIIVVPALDADAQTFISQGPLLPDHRRCGRFSHRLLQGR